VCARDDCRSHQCLGIVRSTNDPIITGTVTRSVCTASCRSDADCPSAMTCAPVAESSAYGGVVIGNLKTSAFACTPRSSD
jgi:hypothetical protein